MLPPHKMFWLLFFLWYVSPICSAANGSTLTADKTLIGGGGDKLISSNGKFALGFFQTGASKLSGNTSFPNWYIGIWFNEIPIFTPVWVANRDEPIIEPALNLTKLTVSGDGNLVILNHVTKSIIWSTQIVDRSKTSNHTIVVLSNNGNLVIQDASNRARVLWQSFDYPTDVFLPGAKMGRNKVTGRKYSFVSRKNLLDPAPGLYCMEPDTSGAMFYVTKICNSSLVYFSSGIWIGKRFLSLPAILDYKFVDNDEEEYFTYTVSHETMGIHFLLDVTGETKLLVWVEDIKDWFIIESEPKQLCDVFAFCGPFTVCNILERQSCKCMKGFSVESPEEWNLDDRRGGCKRNTPIDCSRKTRSKVSSDQFYPMPSVGLPYDAHNMEAVTGAKECMQVCLSNCSCTAYSYSTSGCSIWHGALLNVVHSDTADSNEETLYLRVSYVEAKNSGENRKRQIITGASVCVLVVLVLVLTSTIRRNKRIFCGHPKTNKDFGGVLAFRYAELHCATKKFSEKIGIGGFGSVFKGILCDSATIAVKVLDGTHQGEKQFRAEVSTIGMIQHVNLVKLIGFCCEGDRRMLVYEHMLNRSLDVHLFGSNNTILNWNTRYKIALGIAKGLCYLHESCQDRIIHCDIKPENILLDVSFNPKIADFGMAKLVGRDFSRVLTTMRGTIGYLAPEWISGLPITQKVDVYSYGMMLLEIISGRRNSLEQFTSSVHHAEYFPLRSARTLLNGDVESLVDKRLHGKINSKEVERICMVACWCIQDNDFDRPTMGEVVQVLEGLVEPSKPPVPRLLESILGSSAASLM